MLSAQFRFRVDLPWDIFCPSSIGGPSGPHFLRPCSSTGSTDIRSSRICNAKNRSTFLQPLDYHGWKFKDSSKDS